MSSNKKNLRYLVINGQLVLQEKIKNDWIVKNVKNIKKKDAIAPGVYYQGDPMLDNLDYKKEKPIPFSCFRYLKEKRYDLVRKTYSSIKKDII